MQLKYIQTVLVPQEGPAGIAALAWSPNNLKLAVATNERTILLYDEKGEKRDKFSLKPVDSKFGKKNFTVKGLAFSPDSSKIAVGQTDNIVYVYKIGEDWGEKKVICNKFAASAAVTALIWLTEGPLIFGTADGKVRLGNHKSNKVSTLYGTDSFVVALASNTRGTAFLSGHADGTIVRYYAVEDAEMVAQGRVVTHPVSPYALAWPLNHILAAGCDRKLTLYEKDGRVSRSFDYSREDEKEFTVACCSPSGQAVVIGSYDRLRILKWSPSKGIWEEGPPKEVKNMYSVTALNWRRDGSRVAVGTFCGGVLIFDSVLKKTIWRNKFEMTYVGPSQVLVKPLTGDSRGVILKSQYGHEIDDVRIMGKDRYLLARTSHTLLLGDLSRNLLSEVPWPSSGRNEKFYFDNATVCLIFNAGELSVVEYGENEVISSVRTELMNPHLISVRVNERRTPGMKEDNKKLAYLMDFKTICVLDLISGLTVCQVSHDTKVDWLELNETGHKLLFRDKRQRLILLDTRTSHKEAILTNCSYVQWVPGSDVVVAQSLNNLCVWYNIDSPDRVTLFPIKGEIVDVVREDGRTEVIVQDGVQQLGYELDAGLVEFGTAIHDNDLGRAVLFLESQGSRPEAEGMWRNLAGIALAAHDLRVAARCCAALDDIAKTFYLQETLRIGEEYGDVTSCPEVWARLAILNKDLKTAEQIYLEQNQPEKAVNMYRGFHKWTEAMDLAERKRLPMASELRREYLEWLLSSKQEDRVAELKEKEGDFREAINLYLRANQPGKAANLLISRPYLLENGENFKSVVSALLKLDLCEQAGELYERMKDVDNALECYEKGKSFSKAIDLARKMAPNEVITLEEKWGDHLVACKQSDAAFTHFIEAGKTVKALEAAVTARRWKEAVQIVQVVDKDTPGLKKFYQQIANHLVQLKDFATAEVLYMKGGMTEEVIEMYNKAGLWDRAYRAASRLLPPEEVSDRYLKEAENLEEKGKLKEAETLFVSIGMPDRAIEMYNKRRQFEEMMRMVRIHQPDLVGSTLVSIAEEMAAGKQYRLAETYYIKAGEWPECVNMYRKADMWEDAHRVAKQNGGREAEIQIAFLWAQSLGVERGARLLSRFDLLEPCIDFACEKDQYEYAIDVCKLKLPGKLESVHYKYALSLEYDGKLAMAEQQFVLAGKPKEAISMYVDARQFEEAERVAEKHDKDGFSDILVAQARHALEEGNFEMIESLLLRAQRPDLLIKAFQDSGMWVDALRVCREYLPSKLPALQALYEREVGGTRGGGGSASALLTHAREWEQGGQYKQAIQTYMTVGQSRNDPELERKCLLKAAELTSKFLDADEAVVLCKSLAPRLLEASEFTTAAQLCLDCDLGKEAVDCFISGNEWERARKVAQTLDPALETYVESRYKSHLTDSGDIHNLADVDALGALDLLARQGQWTQCLDMAQSHGTLVLHQYLAQRATALLRNASPLETLQLYVKYGSPAIPSNYNIYKRIAQDMFGIRELTNDDSYQHWAMLRDMLFSLTNNMKDSMDANRDVHHEMEVLQLIAHYFAARAAYREIPQLQPLALKISVALLRYSHILPADRAFYEAGEELKNAGKENEAFIFLNHYLDICEAIDEGNPDSIDGSDFTDTDFPAEYPLPAKKFLDSDQHEEVHSWVLAKSMDQNLNQLLPLDNRNIYESSLSSRTSSETPALPCVVTGYPVLTSYGHSPVTFSKPGRFANREDWNTLIMAGRTAGGSHLTNVINYISDWCGDVPSFSF